MSDLLLDRRPRRRRLAPWAGTAARLLLGVVWVAAALPKAADPIGTANSVRAYRLLPDTAAAMFGYALPWMELVLGVLLLAGVAVRGAAAATAAFMVVFVVGVAQAWARGLSIDCGCFGTGTVADPAAEYLKVIGRDLVLLAVAGWLVARPGSRLALTDRATDPALTDRADGPASDDPTNLREETP